MHDNNGDTFGFIYGGKEYYYDTDTGLYYLKSRYYSPDMCRFINADGVIGANGDIPFFVVTGIIGAVAGAVIGGVVAAKSGKMYGQV